VTACHLLGNPDGLLTRTHLRELGLERRAVDAVFRACPVVALPGYARPLVRVADFQDVPRRTHLQRTRSGPLNGLEHGRDHSRARSGEGEGGLLWSDVVLTPRSRKIPPRRSGSSREP